MILFYSNTCDLNISKLAINPGHPNTSEDVWTPKTCREQTPGISQEGFAWTPRDYPR